MKTKKQIKQECVEFYTQNAGVYFAKTFTKKMGGTQTITFEADFLPTIELNKREYYSGRGAKYNSASMHEHINTFVSKKEFNARVNYRTNSIFNAQKEKTEARKKTADFCKKYGLTKANYSGDGFSGLFFKEENRNAVEKELNIDLTEFFAATGKTYFFAESEIGWLCFYHNHRQSFSFNFASNEEIAEFQSSREKWVSAPYGGLLGQTNDQNLFVC